MVPGSDFFSTPNLVGMAEGESSQFHSSQAVGTHTAQGRSAGTSTSRSSSKATTTAFSSSESVAYTTSSSTSIGKGETRGQAQTRGTQEAFEAIYQDLPTSVHSLENVRYMAAQVLLNLPTGRAAISFVDASGMKKASLRVANVDSFALPPAQFDELRTRVLDASPSAVRLEKAAANLAAREAALIEKAVKARIPNEPEKPAGYRTPKKRTPKREPDRRLHGRRKAAGRAPSRGRPAAVASGDRDP
jgi:hypothetical protein